MSQCRQSDIALLRHAELVDLGPHSRKSRRSHEGGSSCNAKWSRVASSVANFAPLIAGPITSAARFCLL